MRPTDLEDELAAEQAAEPAGEPATSNAGAGDDDALILWMLGLTPTQRLEAAQGFVDSILALRHGRQP
jgi:hypothetical protein